ncbi:hypothetical protein P171DRAFT_436198 [Karstenula rhodostoma CBS 690.94]|uniref:Uncharacterized protein n=1 Tax=Karstenula rhodostoma CBS 690.94 TaxID=1392251 RepID=A0A9P4PAC5_9PLEO|nr:hypothetical protein P171DRAFT_436198 [Karstenula rhodostoma CBS 690.94]
MSTHTSYTHGGTAYPRAAAGQRTRANSPMLGREKHSLESLIDDIDSYIAEQEAYSQGSGGEERLGRGRSDSLGTMFVDMDETGEMVVSYRYQPRESMPVPRQHQRQRQDEGELPAGDLYVIDGGGFAPEETHAPRYIAGRDGAQFIRVGVNALGRGIYVQQREGQRYEVEDRSHRGRRPDTIPTHYQRHHARVYAEPEPPRRPHLPNDYYAADRKGDYPRPMRRVENKPLPPLPRGGHRKRRSFFDAIRGVARKLCSGHGHKEGRVYAVQRHKAGYVYYA